MSHGMLRVPAQARPWPYITKGIEIRTNFERAARVPMWIAGISLCVLAASGIGAIVHSIPVSYANIPDEDIPFKREAAPSDSTNAHPGGSRAQLAVARDTINRRDRSRCRDCGVIESIRQIQRSRDVGTRDTVDAAIAQGVSRSLSGSALVASATTEKNYEIKVRFRDGSTTIFNEANPQTWRLGIRVIVIGRRSVSND
jgi:hypothetical protein